MLGKLKKVLGEPLVRRVFGLLALIILGFGFFFAFETLVQAEINHKYSELENQRAKRSLGKLINEDLLLTEYFTTKLAAENDPRIIAQLSQDIRTLLNDMDAVLDVLEHGGTLSVPQSVNIGEADTITATVDYRPENTDGYPLDIINLRPKVGAIREMETGIAQRSLNSLQDEAGAASHTKSLSVSLKELDTYILSSREHANSIVHEANERIALIEKNRDKLITTARISKLILFGIAFLAGLLFFAQSISKISRILTDREEKEEQLQAAYSTIGDIVNSLPVGVLIMGEDRRVITANQTAADILQAPSPNHLVGFHCTKIICDPQNKTCPVLDKGETISNMELETTGQDKRPIHLLKSAIPLEMHGQKVVLESFMDITDRISTERKLEQLNERLEEQVLQRTAALESANHALKESESRLRQIIDAVPHMIFVKDKEGRFILVNRAAARLYNMNPMEMTGRLHKDLAFRKDELEHMLLSDRKVIETATPLHIPEHTIQTASNKRIWVETTKVPFLTSTESAVLGVAIDTSERHEAMREKSSLELQLRQSQKMEAIGRLAGGVAHDVNNVLGTIISLASVISMELSKESVMRADVDAIISACGRGRDLTRDLLGFARKGKYLKEPVGLNNLVVKTSGILERTLPKGVKLELDLEERLHGLEGDSGQIEHALMNVCINASDAMKGEGTLRIATRNIVIEKDEPPVPSLENASVYISMSVSDTGCGMDPITVDNAFDPFFTTKPKGKGTGLGLSMVYGTVKNHGGHISIESEKGVGTTVNFIFPGVFGPSKIPPAPVDLQSMPPRPQNVSLLLVDDEAMVRRSSTRLLSKLGYTVHEAAGGSQALSIYKENRDTIAVVLLDLIMPDMDGLETFRKLKEFDPDVKVLVLSGFSKDEKVNSMLADGAKGYLQKPFDFKQISEQISRTISTASKRFSEEATK